MNLSNSTTLGNSLLLANTVTNSKQQFKNNFSLDDSKPQYTTGREPQTNKQLALTRSGLSTQVLQGSPLHRNNK